MSDLNNWNIISFFAIDNLKTAQAIIIWRFHYPQRASKDKKIIYQFRAHFFLLTVNKWNTRQIKKK